MRWLAFAIALAACDSPTRASSDGADGSNSDGASCTDIGTVGCACSPVAPGQDGMVATSATITKLVGDPTRCRVYGLAGDRIVVVDTVGKQELAPIVLGAPGYDLDLARDGSVLVISHRTTHQITVIDPGTTTITKVISIPVEPGSLEVTTGGVVFYTTYDQSSYPHRLDLATDTDAPLGDRNIGYQVDLELSVDETHLFVGDSAVSSCNLVEYDVSGAVTKTRTSFWNNRRGFESVQRHVYLSPKNNLYFARHQWRDNDLSKVMGATAGENILAEDDSGTVAIGTKSVWDVALGVPTLVHPEPVAAAAFAASGQEAWMAVSSGLRYAATSDLAGPRAGVRERAPAPLATYNFTQAIYDAERDRLYAIDPGRHVVVSIDPATQTVTGEVVVGAEPSDLAIDRAGGTLYIGHAEVDSLALVDLASFSFVRFAHTPRLPFEVEAAQPGRVVVADRGYDSAPTLFDVASGNAAPTTRLVDFAAIAVADDGQTLFAGDTGSSGNDLFRYTVTSSNLALTGETTDYPFSSAARRIVVAPGGARLFFGSYSVDTSTLTTKHYATPGPVQAISPDGRVAVTPTNVIDVATGTTLGAHVQLGMTAMAISDDSQFLFLFYAGEIRKIALAAYQL